MIAKRIYSKKEEEFQYRLDFMDVRFILNLFTFRKCYIILITKKILKPISHQSINIILQCTRCGEKGSLQPNKKFDGFILQSISHDSTTFRNLNTMHQMVLSYHYKFSYTPVSQVKLVKKSSPMEKNPKISTTLENYPIILSLFVIEWKKNALQNHPN